MKLTRLLRRVEEEVRWKLGGGWVIYLPYTFFVRADHEDYEFPVRDEVRQWLDQMMPGHWRGTKFSDEKGTGLVFRAEADVVLFRLMYSEELTQGAKR